jgi:hypothetical protein
MIIGDATGGCKMHGRRAAAVWTARLLAAGGIWLAMAAVPAAAIVMIEPAANVVPVATSQPAADESGTAAARSKTFSGAAMLLCSLAFTVLLLRGQRPDRDN